MSAFTPVNTDGPLPFTREEAASVLFGLKDDSTRLTPIGNVVSSSGRQNTSSSEPAFQYRSNMIERRNLPSLAETGLDSYLGRGDPNHNTTQLTRPPTAAMQKAERYAKQSLAVIAKKGLEYSLTEVNRAARYQTWNTYQDKFPRAEQEERQQQVSDYGRDYRLMTANSKEGSSKLIETAAQRAAQPAGSAAGPSAPPSPRRGGYRGVHDVRRAVARVKAHADNRTCQIMRSRFQERIAEKHKDKCNEELREIYLKTLSANKKYQEAAKKARDSTGKYYMGINVDNYVGTHPEHRTGAVYTAADLDILIQESQVILCELEKKQKEKEQGPSPPLKPLSSNWEATPLQIADPEGSSSTEAPVRRIKLILKNTKQQSTSPDASPERDAAPARSPNDASAVQTTTTEDVAVARNRKQSSTSAATAGTTASKTSLSATSTSATATSEPTACADVLMQDAPPAAAKPATDKKKTTTGRVPLPTSRLKRALPEAESSSSSSSPEAASASPPVKKVKVKKEVTAESKARQAKLQRAFDQAKVYEPGMTGLKYVHKVLDAKQALLDHQAQGKPQQKAAASKSTDNEKKLMDRILEYNHENPHGACEPCRRFGFEKCYVRPDEDRPVGVDIRCHHCVRSKASILSCNNGSREERDAFRAKADEARTKKEEKEKKGRM